jgi:Tol biopolymer transport system component
MKHHRLLKILQYLTPFAFMILPLSCSTVLGGEDLVYMSRRDGYYGLYMKHGRRTEKIFDSGDILEAYPNLARYTISFDVSPDGRYVAYSALNLLGDADIFLFDTETGIERNLTEDSHTDTYPVFSHDGMYLAFLSHEKGGRRYDEIVLVDRSGLHRKRLTNNLQRISSLAFSPNGEALLYVRHIGDRSAISLLSLSSGESSDLTAAVCLNIRPQFSPSGDRIVYASDCHDTLDIWIMNSDGTGRMPIFKGMGDEYDPHFLDDGQSVVFLSNSSDNGELRRDTLSLFALTLDERALTNLLPPKYRENFFMSDLYVLQKENRIYFQGKRMDDAGSNRFAIYALDFGRSVLRRIVSDSHDNMKPMVRYGKIGR